jgi:hypothetical protein
MKDGNPAKSSKRKRVLLEQQGQEYVDRYYPHWGQVAEKVKPCGRFANVRSSAMPKDDE